MEPIKITDKLTLRQEALRMAIQTLYGGAVNANFRDLVIRRAEDIAEYLQGESVLPEYSDHDKQFRELMAKMQESFKPNPISMWISADSEMKPAKDTTVLIQSKNDGCVLGAWDGKMWINHNADYSSTSLNEGGEILGWMPIPPFTQPTL